MSFEKKLKKQTHFLWTLE